MKHSKRAAAAAAAGVIGITGVLVLTGVSNADSGDPLRCDFNGDGYADLAVGVPFEDISSKPSAGAVNVIYGSADGLAADGNIIFSQGAPGVPGQLETNDHFGGRLACGDVDNDGYAELIVASPFEGYSIATTFQAGTMHVFPGSATGLDLAASSTINRATPGIPGGPRTREEWGADFAMGDPNGDGYDDVIVASLHLDDAYVYIPGSATGLDAANSQRITEGSDDAADEWTLLAVADFTGDGYDDLVLTGWAPTNGAGSQDRLARLLVPGSPAGPDWAARSGFYLPAPFRVLGRNPIVAAAVDVNNDGYADLVTHADGSLWAAMGSPDGLDGAAVYLDLRTTGLAQASSVTSADLDGDDRDELIVGAPGLDDTAGRIFVIPATPTGHDVSGMQPWDQDSAGIRGIAEPWDSFGARVAAADFDGDGNTDLAISVDDEDVNSPPERFGIGAVNVIYGSDTGLTADGNQIWHQGSPGIAGALDSQDRFGTSLPGMFVVSTDFGTPDF